MPWPVAGKPSSGLIKLVTGAVTGHREGLDPRSGERDPVAAHGQITKSIVAF